MIKKLCKGTDKQIKTKRKRWAQAKQPEKRGFK
jgi:hypothetical protein